MSNRLSLVAFLFLPLFATTLRAAEPIRFQLHRIGNERTEACCVGDFNGDGRLDIIAGEYLYLAPDWKRIKIREIKTNVDANGKG